MIEDTENHQEQEVIEVTENHQEQGMIEDWEQMGSQLNLTDDEKALDLLRRIAAALLDLGVCSVELDYSGYEDDGAVESPTFLPGSIEVPVELQRLIEDWVYAVLPSGWEINDGGQGTVTIDVKNCTARIDHEFNVVTTESETYEIG